jgi:hypothetical protein
MAFNLPSAQYLMRSNASNNRGSFDNPYQNGLKNGGNLPITFGGTQVTNSGGNEGIYFGLASQISTTSFDASSNTKVIITSFQFNAPNRIQVGTKAQRGVVARLVSGSGTSDYREFIIGGNDTPLASAQDGPVTICIDLSAISNNSDGGSYDNSNVTGWGFGTFKFNLVGGSSNLCYFQRVFLFDTEKGEPNLPTFTGVSNFDDTVDIIQGDGYTTKIGNWCKKSGLSIFLPCPFSFGDGVNPVQFDDEGISINSPSDNLNNQENFRLTNDAMRVHYNPSPNPLDNSVNLRSNYTWGTAAKWNFDVDAPHTLSGNFTGMGDIISGSGGTISGNFNLASGSSVICNGANINNINVTGDVKIQGDSVTDFSGLTISGILDFDTAGTYNVSGSNINEVTNSSGGIVTINSSNTIITTNNDPNIIINSNTAFALTGLQINSEVRIYEAGTTTELAGVENSGASFITTLSVSSVDVSILSLGFQNLRLKNIDTTVDVALPVQQIVDRQYENN